MIDVIISLFIIQGLLVMGKLNKLGKRNNVASKHGREGFVCKGINMLAIRINKFELLSSLPCFYGLRKLISQRFSNEDNCNDDEYDEAVQIPPMDHQSGLDKVQSANNNADNNANAEFSCQIPKKEESLR